MHPQSKNHGKSCTLEISGHTDIPTRKVVARYAPSAGGGVKSFGCGVFGRLGQGDDARKAAPGAVAGAGL